MNKIALLIMFMITSPVFAKQDAEALYQQAIIPWEQGQPNSGELMLKAADSGSTKALCVIAGAYQGNSLVASDDAQKYFTRAAELGALCGMMGLANIGPTPLLTSDVTEYSGSQNWTEQAISLALKKAKEGDIEAIKFQAYIVGISDYNGYCEWMEKAAALGDPDAMKQLAGHIESGCGWYLMPGSREKAIRYWTEQAASHGNPRAMEQMMTLAEKEQNIDMAINWLNKAMATGNINSVMLFGEYMTAGELVTQQLPPEKRDLVKGYGAFYAITKQLPPNNDNFYYSGSLKRLTELNKKLSPSEIIEAKKWAEEWMKTHQVRTYGLVFN